MKLEFEDDRMPATVAGFFTHVFDVCQAELGLTDKPGSVQLSFETEQLVKVLLSAAIGDRSRAIPIVGGAVKVTRKPDTMIPVTVSIMPLKLMVFSLCHEMVHVRQLTDGRPLTAPGYSSSNYGDIPDDIERAAYHSDPDEIEAAAVGKIVYAKVLASFGPLERLMFEHDRLENVFRALGLSITPDVSGEGGGQKELN